MENIDFELPNIDWINLDTESLFDMSLTYANGDGVDMNYVLAHIFLNIAASRGCQRSVEYRKELSFDMTAEDIAKAQKIARSLLFGNKPRLN